MGTLTFYRQRRFDGGTRTGIDSDGETLLQRFDTGGEDEGLNPALLWWVDVHCEGDSLPTRPEESRDWFLQRQTAIQSGLAEAVQQLSAGIDPDGWPVQLDVMNGEQGTKVIIACSASRRMEARSIAQEVADLSAHWDELLRSLQPAPSFMS